MDQRLGVRNTVIIILAFIVLVVWGFIWRINQPVIMSNEELRINGAVVLTTPEFSATLNLLIIAVMFLIKSVCKMFGLLSSLDLPIVLIFVLQH